MGINGEESDATTIYIHCMYMVLGGIQLKNST